MNNLTKVIAKPDITLYPAIIVKKDTKINYKNEFVEQSLNNLVFKSKTIQKGDNYVSEYNTTINLKENDVLIFEEKTRGYIKPVDEFVLVKDGIDTLKEIEEV